MHLFNKEIKNSYRILVERPEISKLCVSLALHCENYNEVILEHGSPNQGPRASF